MIFGRKKRGMIDIGELARRGGVRKDSSEIPKFETNKDGFVDFSKTDIKKKATVSSSGGSAMDFLETTSSSSNFSSEKDGYSKREVDEKIQKLDSMIYKMEQRIELLERKAGVSSPSGSPGGSVMSTMGW